MYLFCSSLWIVWEKGVVNRLTSQISNKYLPYMIENPQNTSKPQDTRKEALQYTAKFLLNYPNLEWYFFKYMAANFVSFLTIVIQLVYLHWILDVSFLNFYRYIELFKNMVQLQDERVYNDDDTAILRYPKFFFCIQANYGPSGTKQKHEINCNCETNNWVELFLILNIFACLFLLVLSIINIVQTLIAVLLFPYYPEGPTIKLKGQMKDLSNSKRLLALLLAQNVEPMLWDDIVKAINSGQVKKEKKKARKTMKKQNNQEASSNEKPAENTETLRKRNVHINIDDKN